MKYSQLWACLCGWVDVQPVEWREDWVCPECGATDLVLLKNAPLDIRQQFALRMGKEFIAKRKEYVVENVSAIGTPQAIKVNNLGRELSEIDRLFIAAFEALE